MSLSAPLPGHRADPKTVQLHQYSYHCVGEQEVEVDGWGGSQKGYIVKKT